MHSTMFVIGSIFFTAVSSSAVDSANYFPSNLKFAEDWICYWPTKSCYWVTDDVNRLRNSASIVSSAECRYDQPELTFLTSMWMNSFSSSLCGCQYCSFSIPTVSPTVSPTLRPTYSPTRTPTVRPYEDTQAYRDWLVESNRIRPFTNAPAAGTLFPTLSPTDELNWMTFDEEDLFRNQDMTSPLTWINIFHNNAGFSPSTSFFETGAGNYTLFFCIKNLETLSATCEPVVICTPSPACLAKKKDISESSVSVTQKSDNKATGNSLLGLLFIPGFLVGICAAYGYYRVKNRVKETKANVVGQDDNQVSVPQNQPVLQNVQNLPNQHYVQQGHQGVPNAVADQQVTNEGDSRIHGESI